MSVMNKKMSKNVQSSKKKRFAYFLIPLLCVQVAVFDVRSNWGVHRRDAD